MAEKQNPERSEHRTFMIMMLCYHYVMLSRWSWVTQSRVRRQWRRIIKGAKIDLIWIFLNLRIDIWIIWMKNYWGFSLVRGGQIYKFIHSFIYSFASQGSNPALTHAHCTHADQNDVCFIYHWAIIPVPHLYFREITLLTERWILPRRKRSPYE